MPTYDDLYRQVIQNQKDFLHQLQGAFNKKCQEIRAKYKGNLEKAGNDKKAQQPILIAQKKELDQTLEELKTTVKKSNNNTMKKLEELQYKKEEDTLVDLEAELANL